MTDIILSSFISLFALFGKEEQVDETRAKNMLVSYLRHHFGIRNISTYLDLYSDLRIAYEMNDQLDSKSVVASICDNLHGKIRTNEEAMLLLRIMGFCGGKDSQLHPMFKTMAEETRLLEEAEEDSRRKQRFLDSLTHEMRTPLTNIHGYSELMKRVQLSEEDRLRYLDYLMHESRRLNRLSDELFDLIVMRKNTAQMEPVSCAGLLDTVRDSLENKAGGRGVGLVCEQSGARLYGNPALLESLCTNLAENAIRACGEGDEVRMSFQDSGRYVLLRVEDTGMGIPADELKHITEPFYRVDKARSRAQGGVGLGLYLCSEIVRIHGAVMFIDSREGEGTTVTVRFAGEKNN